MCEYINAHERSHNIPASINQPALAFVGAGEGRSITSPSSICHAHVHMLVDCIPAVCAYACVYMHAHMSIYKYINVCLASAYTLTYLDRGAIVCATARNVKNRSL